MIKGGQSIFKHLIILASFFGQSSLAQVRGGFQKVGQLRVEAEDTIVLKKRVPYDDVFFITLFFPLKIFSLFLFPFRLLFSVFNITTNMTSRESSPVRKEEKVVILKNKKKS